MDGLAAGLTSQPPCHFIKKARTMTDTRSSSPTAYDGFHLQSIAGQWRQGSSGKPKADRNPYSGETLVKIVQADRNDLDAAYRAAKAAQPGWEAQMPGERAAYMAARSERRELWLIKLEAV
jgi:aldehyde dehydrogenase (NAD+)